MSERRISAAEECQMFLCCKVKHWARLISKWTIPHWKLKMTFISSFFAKNVNVLHLWNNRRPHWLISEFFDKNQSFNANVWHVAIIEPYSPTDFYSELANHNLRWLLHKLLYCRMCMSYATAFASKHIVKWLGDLGELSGMPLEYEYVLWFIKGLRLLKGRNACPTTLFGGQRHFRRISSLSSPFLFPCFPNIVFAFQKLEGNSQ